MTANVPLAHRFAAFATCFFWSAAADAVAGTSIHVPLDSILDRSSHALVGAVAAVAGVLAHRAWSRRRWHRAPAGVVIESVLAVDLVNSTWLATHHGEDLAMRARNVLERRALEAAGSNGVVFVESTGDGLMMTFATVHAAAASARALLEGLLERPPAMAPAPDLEVRAGISYGQILLDANGSRHGATINKAFRLMSVLAADFVAVEGEDRMMRIPDRNRLFLDEDAANELRSPETGLAPVGVCRLKGFSGFHRVFQLRWNGGATGADGLIESP